MFVTILSGRVSEENWRKFERSVMNGRFEHAPKGMLSSILIQCQGEPKLWEIITTWESEEIYNNAHRAKAFQYLCRPVLQCRNDSIPQ